MPCQLCDRCSSNQELSIERPDCANCAARIGAEAAAGTRSRCRYNFAASTLRIDAAKVGEAQMLIDRIEPGVLIHTDTEPDEVPAAAPSAEQRPKPMECRQHDSQLQLWPLVLPAFYLPSDLYIE